jgi:hypothetical protein
MAIDISDIISEFGLLYKAGSQSVKDIRKKIFVMAQTDKLFARQLTDDTRLDGGAVSISPVLQAYQDAYTPYGTTTFTGKKIDLYELKIDWEENPSKIEKSWLGFLAGDGVDRKQWPIIKYIINELIIAKAAEDWELNGIFNGSPTSITPGTPKPIEGAVKGIKALINEGVSSGGTTPYSLGAVPTNDAVLFVKYMNEWYKMLPKEILPFLQQFAMSHTLFDLFKEGMGMLYNMNYAQAPVTKIFGTDLVVEGFRSHEGSTKIWTTIKGNAQMGMKRIANENVFTVEGSKRTVSAYTDFWKGIGYWRDDLLITNDVELS